jgi:hypothetical protein
MALNPALQALIKNQKAKYSRSTGKAVKLKEGKTTIRLLWNPAHDATGKFWRDYAVHWIKTELNGKPVAVVGCKDHTYEQPCEICAAIDKAIKSAVDDDSVKLYKEWKPKKGVLVNALIRKGPDESEDTPIVLDLTPTTFGTILSVMEEYGDTVDVLDLKAGIDFVIERKGKGLDTEYVVMPAPMSKPVKAGVVEKTTNLDDFIAQEYFRGEETKALNAIAQVTGLKFGAIAAPRGNALLTSSAGTVVEEEEEAVALPPKVAAKAAPAKAAAPAAKVEEVAELPAEEIDDLLADLDNL